MNALVVGANKEPLLDLIKIGREPLLLIDDGPLIDAVKIPRHTKPVVFDVEEHGLNPLQELDYRRARDFISLMGAIFPEGENTLTKKNADFVLLEALLKNAGKKEPLKLNELLRPDKRDPAKQDAYQKIQTILLSPVLSKVLCQPTNFSMKGIVLARLDRAVLGDFDAFVLASFLISQFDGQVVVVDGGFYLRDHHIALTRLNRLIAGVDRLSQLSDNLRDAVLSIPKRIGSRSLFDDAEVLAKHAGLLPDPTRTMQGNPYDDFIKDAMS